jgi:PAS domain S-box-containing protein
VRLHKWLGIKMDITEHKLADEARFRLAAIVESSDDAIVSKTVEGVILSWNRGARQIYGYTEAEAVGKSITILVPPDLLDEENKILATLRAGEHIDHYETIRITKAGKRINVSLSLSPIRDSRGAILGVCSISRDITERKMVEDKLREYERAVEGSGELIAVVDREYRYLIANNHFLKLKNMTKEQVVGHFAHEVLHKPFFESVVKPKLDECFQGKVVSYEAKYSYPEIGERDLLISYFPIEGASGIDRVASIMHDITDRRRSEESLRESEQRLRLAAQAGKMYSFEWDVATDVVVRSPERARVVGDTAPQRVSHEQFVNTIHSDDRPRFISTIAALTPQNPTAEVTYRVQGSDGGLVWLRSSGRAIFDSDGKMLRVIGMVADVTDLKRSEEALSDMARKLIEAQEQERARIGRELHDDINQRLAVLAVALAQLQSEPSDIQSRARELQKDLAEISSDVQALTHELHSSSLEYMGVCAGMKSWCKVFAERQRVEVDFRGDVTSVLTPEIGLTLFRVLQEALHNVIKHSGVKHAEVRLREDSGEIRLTVRDLGRGFDIDAATQRSGLGLTSMRERVRLVNGTITIDSKPRAGTTIHVCVPRPSERSAQRKAV